MCLSTILNVVVYVGGLVTELYIVFFIAISFNNLLIIERLFLKSGVI